MVVFVNKLTVVGPTDQLEELYARIGAFMSAQPGILRYQLVRSTKAADVYFNIAEWETAEDFKRALATEEFRDLYADLKPLIRGDAHLSEVVQTGTAAVG
ncbi:antibiotic biosynthesis monooxygenase family protein [Micromonospora zhanjiangensis]|uniref:Antibiotic biosynthesis monooxygenase family protein n=1 Tax=Micromonospora zhanjiangensis TaxID=1522057 RepID=A0ABV8KVR9_9ACTN